MLTIDDCFTTAAPYVTAAAPPIAAVASPFFYKLFGHHQFDMEKGVELTTGERGVRDEVRRGEGPGDAARAAWSASHSACTCTCTFCIRVTPDLHCVHPHVHARTIL